MLVVVCCLLVVGSAGCSFVGFIRVFFCVVWDDFTGSEAALGSILGCLGVLLAALGALLEGLGTLLSPPSPPPALE